MSELRKTVLAEWHQEHGAKMVEFAGFYMPVQYALGVLQEHLHTRKHAGLFDVSHMGQIVAQGLDGSDVTAALEAIFPADLQSLPVGKQCYSLLLSDDGGVLDDLMICRRENDFLLVVNAGCKDADFAYLCDKLGDEVQLQLQDDRALLALQGPEAESVLQSLGADVANMVFMQGAWLTIAGIECWVTRSGYTGEDGFELSLPNDRACELADKLIAHASVELIGLGARDSLRLEAGLCLYGHELSPLVTPIEASLSWAIAKVRREGELREGGFIGSAAVLAQMGQGAAKKRIGLLGSAKVPVREGAELFDAEGNSVGEVTSGGYGPCVEKPIAIASVHAMSLVVGDSVFAQVRKNRVEMQVVKLPFIASNYKR